MSNSERPPDEEIRARFEEFARTRSRRLRNRLVEQHMGLAIHFVRRYARRGAPDDDLRQVAMMALVKAVDRFDPDKGFAFSTFAGRTIEGELKRHFRDTGWVARVPRSMQELHLGVRRAGEELAHELGRSPTPREVAEHLDIDVDDVVAALAASKIQSSAPLDTPGGDDAPATDRRRALASVEPGFDAAENRMTVQDLLETLEPREREIVALRFFENLTQSEIAQRTGISQMHVSRLLRRSFAEMREAAER